MRSAAGCRIHLCGKLFDWLTMRVVLGNERPQVTFLPRSPQGFHALARCERVLKETLSAVRQAVVKETRRMLTGCLDPPDSLRQRASEGQVLQ